MDLTIPGISFLTSSIQLKFNTDGCTTCLEPSPSRRINDGHILILSRLQAQQHRMTEIPSISLFDRLPIPDGLTVPEIYDGTQDLHGRKVLILMLNGWGDLILIQPAIRALYRVAASTGEPPRITLGCNWIRNFPYPDADYIEDVIPNILTLAQLRSFDVLIDLLPINHQRTAARSMRDLCLDILHLGPGSGGDDPPEIHPDPERLSRVRPFFERIRRETGKGLLYLNWKSRFPHKNAPPSLLFQVADRLQDTCQAVVLKDEDASQVMQQEIDAFGAPIMNLSHLIHDYHDTVAALSLVDSFVSVDTGIVHAAGAMGVPGVALFGPFPPETHVADYPSVVPVRAGFRGEICDGPCLETHRGCAEVGYSPDAISPCFEAIDADDVLAALEASDTRAAASVGNRAGIMSPETRWTPDG
jgi:ADP-heptose:LPS heptosyltransferase